MNPRSLPILAFFFLSVAVSEAGFGDSALLKASQALRSGRYPAALKALRQGEKGRRDSRRVLFLRGLTLMGLEHWEEAKATFLLLRGKYPPLRDYVERNLLACDRHLNHHQEVLVRGRDFLAHEPASRLVPGVRLLLIKSYMALKKWRKAETLLRRMLETRAKSLYAPESYLLYHEVLTRLGRGVEAYQALQKVYYYFPAGPEARISEKSMREMRKKNQKTVFPPPSPSMRYARLSRLAGKGKFPTVIRESAGVLSDKKYPKSFREKIFLLRGVCYRSLKDYSRAVETYQRYVRQFPLASHVPEAQYWTARIQWNRGNLKKALGACDRLIARHPKDPWALRAYLIAGGVLVNRGDFAGAVKRYLRLLKQSPENDLAEKARWKTAWIYYQKKNYAKSLKHLKKLIRGYPLSPRRERALFWAARCAKELQRPKAAEAFLSELSRTHSFGFYMHLAEEVFGAGKYPDPFTTNFYHLPEAAFRQNRLPEALKAPGLSPGAGYHLERARELTEIALSNEAREELKFVRQGINPRKADEVLWLGLLYYRARAYRPLLSLMDNFLITVPPANRRRLPELFWRLYYPPAYRDIVMRVSAKYEVDPYLLLGLMRQESSFEETSLSSAGALGLMQLIPQTGERVFQKLYKGQHFTADLLYEPERNIEIGSFHLARLIKKNGGNMIDVLAGYNAGSRIFSQWEKRFAGMRGEGFIEMIPYGETRRYIKRVLRNYYNYRSLYGKER